LKSCFVRLPLPDLPIAVAAVLKPEILLKRTEERVKSGLNEAIQDIKYTAVPESEYGMRLIKALIVEIKALFTQNKLHSAFLLETPKPLFTFFLVPSYSASPAAPAVKGIPQEDQDYLPRHLREKRKTTSRPVLQLNSKANIVLNIVAQDEECTEEPADSGESHTIPSNSLLSEGKLGWTSVGKDNYSLQLEPNISDFEEKLKEMLDLPLISLSDCPTVASEGSVPMQFQYFRTLYCETLSEAQETAMYSLFCPLAIVAILRQYDYLLQEDQQQLLNSMISAHIGDYSGLSQELATISDDLQVIQQTLPNNLHFGLVELSVSKYKRTVWKHGERLVRCLLEELQSEYSGLLYQSAELFASLMQELHRSPQTVEELQEISDYLKKGRDAEKFAEISSILQQASTIQSTLDAYNTHLTEKQMEKTWETKVWQTELRVARTRTQARINKARPGFIEQVLTQSADLYLILEDTQRAIGLFEDFQDLDKTDDHAASADSIMVTLKTSQEQTLKVNFREKVLGIPETDFSDFTALFKSFAKYSGLWGVARDWLRAAEEWNFNNFRQINGEVVNLKYSEWSRLLAYLQTEFQDKEAPLAVVAELQTQMNAFQHYVTLIMKLRHPALKDRHWDGILGLLKGNLKMETLNLHSLMKADVLAHVEEINFICYQAVNEFEVERVLQNIEESCNFYALTLIRDFDFPDLAHLNGLEEAENVIQEQLTTLTFIQTSSKFALVFKSRIDKAKTVLNTASTTVKDVKDLQTAWLQTFPLFNLPEIAKIVGREGHIRDLKDFYTRQTEAMGTNQNLAVITDTRIKTYVEAQALLDSITADIERVIRGKAQSFPRLLFLSMRELKEFLGQVARRGQLTVTSLYAGLGTVSLRETEITEVSRGTESLQLHKAVSLQDGQRAVPVESWLQDFDASLRNAFQHSLVALAEAAESREDWWRNCEDSQVLALAQQVWFTRKVFGTLSLEDSVKSTCQTLKQELQSLITEVRPIFGTPGQSNIVLFKGEKIISQKLATRIRLEKLVLVVLSQLHTLNSVTETAAFDWEDLLWKMVFKLELTPDSRPLEVKVTFFDLTKAFGFEWLPLPLPLYVSTPISERCMLNLVCALKHNTSGLLQGGPGSSKSETLKEMALLYGRSVLSLTMANGAHSYSIQSALIGSLATGAWLCLEEIDLLDPMLINFLVFYLPKVSTAQRLGIREMPIEGQTVRVHEGFACWALTTQPKLHLPMRFLECFRCVALVQPDLAAVAEVRIFALGLSRARELSRRIARALTLLADDCSSLFRPATSRRFKATSLRLLHKVVDSMAVVLDNFTVTDDNYLLSNVLSRVLKVGLNSSEEALLDEFLTTIFRSPHNSILAGIALANETTKLKEVLSTQSLSGSDNYLRCLRALWNCISDSDRRVILLAGPPASGKSTLISTLSIAFSQYNNVSFNVHTLSGQVSNLGLNRILETCSSPLSLQKIHCTSQPISRPDSPFTSQDWVCIDSETVPSDGLLAIARNQVCLEDVINVSVSKALRVIAEVETLASAAPSLMSEASTIYCAENDFLDEEVFKNQIRRRFPMHEEVLMALYQRQYRKLMENVEEQVLVLSKRVCLLLFCKWLFLFLAWGQETKTLLMGYRLEIGLFEKEKEAEMTMAELQVSWVLSLVACLGQISKSRIAFSEALLRICKEEDISFACNLISYTSKKRNSTLFDITYSFPQKAWLTWAEMPESPSPTTHIPQLPTHSQLFIDTDSTKKMKFRLRHALKSHTDLVIIGPHQCGKTAILTTTLREELSTELVSTLPIQLLTGTNCDTVEHQVEEAMDQYRPYCFGALGGIHHFVFIEDMNLDGNSVYDDLRFCKERQGWYNRDEFHSISDLTLCLAHSYSPHRFRPINQRSIRHFLLLYKSQYTDSELQTIFTSISNSADLGHSLYTQFARMRLDLSKLERCWQHSTLSNYIGALAWVRTQGCADNMFRKYFGDQLLVDSPAGFFIPGALLEGSPLGYFEISESSCQDLAAKFESIRSISNEKYAEYLKFFKEPLANPTEQKARQLYHFCQVVDDLQSSQHSIIVVERELKTVRALMYMAAEFTGLKVVSTSLADLSSEMINSMAEGQSNYLATDTKFALKIMLDDAANKDRKILCLISLDEDTNLHLPMVNNLLEFCSDLALGKVTKSIGPYTRTEKTELYPCQVKQIVREKMQKNVIFAILMRTDLYNFDRVKRTGPLEFLKHNFRSLFNVCRLVSYERQAVPAGLKAHIKQHISENADLMRDLALVTAKPLEEFALEQIWYLADAIKRFDESAITAKIAIHRQVVTKLGRFEQEIEKSSYVLETQSQAESLRTQLQTTIAEKEGWENKEEDAFEAQNALKDQIERERQEMKEQVETCEKTVIRELDSLGSKRGLADSTEANLLLLGALQSILFPKVKAFPFDQPSKYQSHCKPILSKLASSLSEVVVKLHNIESDQYPDLSEFLRAYTALARPASQLEDLVVAMESLRVCLSQMSLKQSEWLEAPLRLQEELSRKATMRSKSSHERLLTLKQTITRLEVELSGIEDKLQEIAVTKPMLLRILGELREVREDWQKKLETLIIHLEHIQGNALLKAVFFVASLNSDLAGRERVREKTQTVLKNRNIAFESDLDLDFSEDSSISDFLRDSMKGCKLIWELGLPYPVFVDPFSLAADILAQEMVTIRYSSELRKDSSLLNCIQKGRTVLLIEPTEGMVQSLMPLLHFRYSNSIKTMRGADTTLPQVRLGLLNVEVHPDFRLYISLIGKPTLALAQIGTVISLEPSDAASWRTSVLVRLSKIHAVQALEPQKDLKYTKLVLRTATNEAISSVYSPGFQTLLKVLLKQVETKETRRNSSSSDESSDNNQLQDTYLELLAIAGDLSAVLQTLKLGEWSISPQIFRTLLLSACEEQIKRQGFPSADQIAMFTGPILYRFVVRLLWLLPVKAQNSVLLCYCLKRHCEEGLFSRTIRAISMGLSMPFSTDARELEGRWETLKAWFALPPSLSYTSPDLSNFHSKDLFAEASFPEGLDIRTQAVLYSWFRQDLLPLFIDTLVVQALGRRFTYLPDVDFSMAARFVGNQTAMVVFFRKTYPLPWLSRAAEVHEADLVHVLPLTQGRKANIKSEARLERILREFGNAANQRKWLVLEGLECLNKSEVERLEKHFFEFLHRCDANEHFRLWLLFQHTPAELPAWSGFLKTAFRLVFRDPKTVREHLMVSQELFDPVTYEAVSSRKRQMYQEYSQLELPMLRRMDKRVTRINPVLRASVTKQLRSDVHRPSTLAANIANFRRTSTRNASFSNSGASVISSEGETIGSYGDFYCYNLTLVVSALRLRSAYCSDLPIVLSLKEVRNTIKEAMTAGLTVEGDIGEQSLSMAVLFLQVIGASWDESGFYAALNFIKHAVLSQSKALKFEYKDESGSWSEIQYPLYKITGNSTQKSIDGLLFDMPKEDHLQLIGQPHCLARSRHHRKSAKIGLTLPSVESLMDLQPVSILQKISDIGSALKGLVRGKPEDREVDLEALKVVLSREESRRYSYFFVPDRYRTVDYYTLSLKNPPSFPAILANLEELNARNYDFFFTSAISQLEHISGYLNYSTAQISSEDLKTLDQLRQDRTPQAWCKRGPYSLRREGKCSLYIGLLKKPKADFARVIDFSQVFNPAGLVTALLRSLTFLQKYDVEFAEFEIEECEEGSPLPDNSVLITGLWLFNATMQGHLMQESYNAPPTKLPTFCCRVVKKHKNLDIASINMPPGVFLFYHRSSTERLNKEILKEEQISASVSSAFRYQRTDWLEATKREVGKKAVERHNKILCPVFPASSATKLWMILHSDKPQGHWSKRGVKVDLP